MTIDWRRVLVVEMALLGACALAVVAWWLLGRFAHTVLVLLMGVVVAFALGPLVGRLEHRVGGRRGLAAAIVYLALVVVVLGGMALLARPFASQLAQLASDLPRYAELAKVQM